jgi:LmbE family N-acetylglucosaminyl deacetylase
VLAARPGSIVLTVFAGIPDRATQTSWDRRCGFDNSADAVSGRRAEDALGLAPIGATPRWLEFFDGQYERPSDLDDMVARISDCISQSAASLLLLPLGLFHPDHLLTHAAGMRASAKVRGLPMLCYEDALYRRFEGRLQQRLMELADSGFTVTPASLSPPSPTDAQRRAKRASVAAYRSQISAFSPEACNDLEAPERLWAVRPARP